MGAYVTNLDENFDIGTHWTVLYELNDNVIYFGSFGVKHVAKQIKNLVEIKI